MNTLFVFSMRDEVIEGMGEWSWINKSVFPPLMAHNECCKRYNFVCNKKANPYLGTLFLNFFKVNTSIRHIDF